VEKYKRTSSLLAVARIDFSVTTRSACPSTFPGLGRRAGFSAAPSGERFSRGLRASICREFLVQRNACSSVELVARQLRFSSSVPKSNRCNVRHASSRDALELSQVGSRKTSRESECRHLVNWLANYGVSRHISSTTRLVSNGITTSQALAFDLQAFACSLSFALCALAGQLSSYEFCCTSDQCPIAGIITKRLCSLRIRWI